MPRILFCCPTPLTATLGASKVYLEAGEAFRRIGWEVTLVGPETVAGGPPGDLFDQPRHLREYLRREADGYDVVEYEHHALPFPRTHFPPRPLFVARSVLLAQVQAAADILPMPTLRSRLGWALFRRRQQAQYFKRLIAQADATVRAADLVNLPNSDERDLLLAAGLPVEKLLVQPFGLFPERLAAFAADPDRMPDPPRVGFVGTFDPRKGMCEWPAIAAEVAVRHPTVRFRLVGTAGQVRTVEGVRRCFPARLRDRVEVVETYTPGELPGLLADATVGAFPSYCEGFPFGVLEMLTAGLPVVAYRTPGAPMMLPPEDLVGKGDGRALGRRLAQLLADPNTLREKRATARLRAEGFGWVSVAERTAERYLRHLHGRRADPHPEPARANTVESHP